MKTTFFVLLALVLPFLVGIGIANLRSEDTPPAAPSRSALSSLVGAQVAEINGDTTTVRRLAKVDSMVALAIFSLNCGSCYGEAVQWQELADRYPHLPFAALVYADSSTGRAAAAEFARVSGITLPFAAISRSALENVGLRVMPTTVVVIRDSVAFVSDGANATADLMGWLSDRYESATPSPS